VQRTGIQRAQLPEARGLPRLGPEEEAELSALIEAGARLGIEEAEERERVKVWVDPEGLTRGEPLGLTP